MRHHVCVAYDYVRVGNAIRDARLQLGLSQKELAVLADVFVSTIQNLEGRRRPKKWPPSIGAVERALGKPEGWARSVAEGRDVPVEPVVATPTPPDHESTPRRGSLIDPESPDPVIRELSTGPVRTDEFREELIRLYLDDLAEGRRRAEERAAEKVRRLAAAAAGESSAEREMQRKLDQLAEFQRQAELEDKGRGLDGPGHSSNTA